jgi:division protein CdvB (Snf7/Vps24/ESCRT-III family)
MSENLTPPSVPEMLRLTGANQAEFMQQVAAHIETLEDAVKQLQARVEELELQNDLGVVGPK